MTSSPPRSTSLAARSLLAVFAFWTAVVLVLWLTGWGEAQAARWSLRTFGGVEGTGQEAPFLARALRWVDAFWVVLAALTAYASVVRTQGLKVARPWLLWIVGVSFAAGLLSIRTGWPHGPLWFSGNLGPRLLGVPLGWPLLWCALVLGAREFARLALPRAGHGLVAGATGLLVLAAAVNLEPVAWRSRGWWLWAPEAATPLQSTPLQSYLAWGFLAGVLASLFRAPAVARATQAREGTAAIVFLLLNVVFLLTRLAA